MPTVTYSLTDLNAMSRDEFTAALGEIFEHTPEIATAAWQQHPFADVMALHGAMVTVVEGQSAEEQTRLIRAHPDLGSKAKMAAASVAEQSDLGLNALPPDEYEWLRSRNAAYVEKFGFPFVIAVKHHTKASIFAALEMRLQSDLATEQKTAIAEICEIARLRLVDLVSSPT